MNYIYLKNIIYVDSKANKCEYDVYTTIGKRVEMMRFDDDITKIFDNHLFIRVPKYNERFAYINKNHIVSVTIDSNLTENKYEGSEIGNEPRYNGQNDIYRKLIYNLNRDHTVVSILTRTQFEEAFENLVEDLPVGFLV